MARVICVCGRLCTGKTSYAKRLCRDNNAVLLSVDEIMLAIFGQYTGDKHEEYVHKIYDYLYEKAAQIVEAGVDVVFDWGFWTKDNRTKVKEFFGQRDIRCDMHYIDIRDEDRAKLIEKRNASAEVKQGKAYYIDDKLIEKFNGMFEMPAKNEIDVWIIT